MYLWSSTNIVCVGFDGTDLVPGLLALLHQTLDNGLVDAGTTDEGDTPQ